MSDISTDLENNTVNAQRVMYAVLNALVDQGRMNEEDKQEWLKTHAVIIVTPSWFKGLMLNIYGKDTTTSYYQVVKLANKCLNTEEVSNAI